MCDKENCNCGSNPCCGDCEPWNCIEQAVNDVWSTKKGQIEELVERSETATENSEASAQASAGSAAEAKEFRDEAEQAATTAVAAEGVVLGVANTLQDTADKLEQIADELGTAIAGISVVTWYYTAVSDNQTMIPVPTDKNQVDIQAIYIEGARQEPNRGFMYDALNKEITLAEGIPLGMEISIIIGTYSDNPDDFANTLASINGASLVGSSNGDTVETRLSNLDSKVDPSLRANLGSGEEGFGDAIVQHNKNFSVREMLNRIRTLADNDAPLPYLGYDPVNDAALYNAMGEASDRHLLLNGGLHIAGDCANGIRRNANLLSVRGGQKTPGQGFNVPILGVATARDLRGYDISEIVPFYFDVTTPERQPYNNVASATYTATTATIDPVTYAETLAELSDGDYIRTWHTPYCLGIVQNINPVTGVITVDEWAVSKTSTTTPANGIGLYTEFITKAYAGNINLFITANSDVTNASGVELGMSSHKLVSGTVAGLDIPVLSSSTQNMTVGLLVRAATTNGTGLDFSVRASDARVNFHSDGTDGIGRAVRVGFNESSNAITGFRGNGKNTSYLMLASTVTDITDTSLENSPMILGPYGQDYRKYDRAIAISSDTTLNGYFPNVTLTAAGITITFPPAAAHKSGHYYYFNLRAAGDYFFQGDVPVEGNTPYKVTTTVVRKTIKIQYDGSQWLVYGDK